ncbi:MAG: hypothetical protein JEY71_02475 [Sphaerochaeta sp.]|nr:hypothetical protein [Sphaerochaeta sp.]
MDFKVISHDTVAIYSDKNEFCQIVYSLSFSDRRIPCSHLSISGQRIIATFSDIGSITDACTLAETLLTIERTWRLNTTGNYRLQASFQFEDTGRENQFMIPAVWYRNNSEGKGLYPSLKIAKHWSFLETRMSVPSCMQLYNGKRCVTCSTSASTEERYLSSVTNNRHGMILSIPGSEWPCSYQGKTSLHDTSDCPLPSLEIHSVPHLYSRSFYVSNIPEQDSVKGYRLFLETMPFPEPSPTAELPWQLWFEYKLTRLLHMVKRTSRNQAYILMGEGNGDVQEVYNFTSASFLVKSLQAAFEMVCSTEYIPRLSCLVEARRQLAILFDLTDNKMLLAHVASKIGGFFLQAEQDEGVFQDCYDIGQDIWGGYLGIGEHDEYRYLVNSRCNGEAMKHYVLLYSKLEKLGIPNGNFMGVARRVASFYCEYQLSSGSFGRWWTNKGKPVDINGTNGAYIGSFFSTLLPILDDSDPLRSEIFSAMNKAYQFYAQVANEGNFYGDTLDADSCDKEAGVALLEFFLDLYDLEQDQRYLESAEIAANFILMWIWQTDGYLPRTSPLGKQGFHTTGMTSVSIAHHHLDFYGMHIAYDFLRLAEAIQDPFYKKQAVNMIGACNQLVATEKNMLGRDRLFIGWQPEQINHTQWEYFERKEKMNGVYDIDIAWVTVLTLGYYQKIKDRFPDIIR